MAHSAPVKAPSSIDDAAAGALVLPSHTKDSSPPSAPCAITSGVSSSFLGSDMNFFLPQQIVEFTDHAFVGTVRDHLRGSSSSFLGSDTGFSLPQQIE